MRECFQNVSEPEQAPIAIAILAGGKSRRMGRDKAWIAVEGEPMLVRTARAAAAAGCPVMIVGRGRPGDWPVDGITFVLDTRPGSGPLGGLADALAASGSPVLAIGCDMPRLTTGALKWLIQAGNSFARDGVVTSCGAGGIEPLFSVYNQAVLPLIVERLQASRLSLRGLIEAGNFRFVEAPTEICAALTNVNTPQDIAALRGLQWISVPRNNPAACAPPGQTAEFR